MMHVILSAFVVWLPAALTGQTLDRVRAHGVGRRGATICICKGPAHDTVLPETA
jgi:hypothetical protein